HSGKRVQDRHPAQGDKPLAWVIVTGPPPWLGDGYRTAALAWVTVTGPPPWLGYGYRTTALAWVM
ncbi:hypothetical protein KI387_020322, partial [Taxus chinensis]